VLLSPAFLVMGKFSCALNPTRTHRMGVNQPCATEWQAMAHARYLKQAKCTKRLPRRAYSIQFPSE
jgi:hypothetical protein